MKLWPPTCHGNIYLLTLKQVKKVEIKENIVAGLLSLAM